MSHTILGRSKGSFRVYGAGGAGINSVMNIQLPTDAAGFPDIFYALVDTSRSNIPVRTTLKADTYIVPGIDGSGKDRQFAHQQCAQHIDDILLQCPPKDFNVVIFGLSGGSGSVLGPLLMDELISRGQTAVGICVTSTASAKEAENAYMTIGTLQNISVKKLRQPISCCFYENSDTMPRSMVDVHIENNVRALAMLSAGSNLELDKKDLANWLRYDKVTPVAPQLTDLSVFLAGKDIIDPELTAISVANLLQSKSEQEASLGQLYSCVGYCPQAAQDAISHPIPSMHFVISNQYMEERIANLKKIVDAYTKNKKTLLDRAIPSFEETASTDGFLF